MKELLKTILLSLLVLGSLLQSYMLAYSTPKFEPIHQEQYVPTKLVGTQQKIQSLLFPRDIILHSGKATHSLLYPNTNFYNLVLSSVEQQNFDEFHQTNYEIISNNWNDIRNKNMGIEIQFQSPVPLTLLQKNFNIKGTLPVRTVMVTEIWLFVQKERGNLRAFFFTTQPSIVYEASKVGFVSKDLEQLVGFGQFLTPYQYVISGDYYLPEKSLSFIKMKVPFTEFTTEQLRRNLFVDPEMTKNLLERDGSVIYTDGKRGLQVKKGEHWFSYSDPIAPLQEQTSVKDDLLSAAKYINQHGGWNGTFVLNTVSSEVRPGQNSFVFRQYIHQLPIFSEDQTFGFIKVVLQKAIVSNYERSMIILGTQETDKSEVTLPGGEMLKNKLEALPLHNQIINVFPAYQAKIEGQSIDLIPIWVIQLHDGRELFLQ